MKVDCLFYQRTWASFLMWKFDRNQTHRMIKERHSNHRLIVERSTILDELWDAIEVIFWNQRWWTLKQKITLYVRWNWKAKDINYFVHKMKLLTQSVLSRSSFQVIKRYEDFSIIKLLKDMKISQRMKHWHRNWSVWWEVLINVFQRMKHWHRNRNVWWEMFSSACLFQVEEFFVYVKMRMSWRFESCSRRQWRFSQEWRINTKYKIQRMLREIISRLRLFYVERTCDLHQHKTKKWRIRTTKRSNLDVSSSIIVKECSRTMSKKISWSTINDDLFKTNTARISFMIWINKKISKWIETRIVTIACQD
jgi:hypothetical protein